MIQPLGDGCFHVNHYSGMRQWEVKASGNLVMPENSVNSGHRDNSNNNGIFTLA